MQDQPSRLRPLDLTGIIDSAIALYRQNFALFAGVVAVLAVPEAILTTIVTFGAGTSSNFLRPSSQGGNPNLHFQGAWAVGFAATTLLSFIFGIVITGALARVISARYLAERMTVGEAYTSVGVGRFAAVVAASLLLGITVTIPPIIATIALIVMVVAGAPVAAIVLISIALFVGAIVLDIKMWVHFLFIPQSIVIERRGIIDSFRRSWDLVRGSYWRVFGITLLVMFMVSATQGIIGAVVGVPLLFTLPQASVIVSALLGILFQPFQYGALTLLYYDLRVRKEGFDLEHLAAQHAGDTLTAGDTQPAL
jgi:hypothetical protein